MSMVFVLVALAVLFPVMNHLGRSARLAITDAATAHELTSIANAAQHYILANSATVQSAVTTNGSMILCVPNTPGTCPAGEPDLTNGYLPYGFKNVNSYQQSWEVVVGKDANGNLEALVESSGGVPIDGTDASEIASEVHSRGGAIGGGSGDLSVAGCAANQACGAYSGWGPVAVGGTFPNPGPGHVVALLDFNGDEVLNGSYLYRVAVPGHPELNTMTVPMIMSATETTGSTCTTVGAIAQDGSGVLLSCENQGASDNWETQGSMYWQNPVANYASLPACSSANAYETRVVETPSVGTGPRAYTCNGASWSALAVDDSGNLTVAGTLTANNATVSGTSTLNNLAGNLTVTPTASVGNACSPNGRIAQDGTGVILSCQSGAWQQLGGSDVQTYQRWWYSSFASCGSGCLYVSKTFSIPNQEYLVASAYAAATSPDSGVTQAEIVFDGTTCSVARNTEAAQGYNEDATTSCVQWLGAGSHTVTVYLQTVGDPSLYFGDASYILLE
ncbi:MAG: shufflon system plasmid conjugative transfer pilus tip adhesin PilV [Betaproteobacteria bacterium]|nr:shufflon system plasmid conjugative transfer pilus tip adhesin PilV [Betaproteobacteria bacterium]